VNGKEVTVSVEGNVKVDGAIVIAPNLEASNGVVHVIDAVIIPK
jgi:uncharacterized surface protein with fasciclin (FAS1) repeats